MIFKARPYGYPALKPFKYLNEKMIEEHKERKTIKNLKIIQNNLFNDEALHKLKNYLINFMNIYHEDEIEEGGKK